MKVSIIMLTYNAPVYVRHSIKSVKNNTIGVDYELIVYDNASSNKTKRVLNTLYRDGWIDRLFFSDKNYYFVGGNNRAVMKSSEDAEFILLLNSDIEIRNKKWLSSLLEVHKRGITACQVCDEYDLRPDGWCLLVDKDIYNNLKLDEKRFTWYFSIADFASRVMNAGYSVQSIRNYKHAICHFGGASEISTSVAVSSLKSGENVSDWFPHRCNVIDVLNVPQTENVKSYFEIINIFLKIQKRIKRILH